MNLNKYFKKRFFHIILICFIFSSMSNCGYREKNSTVDTKEIDINTTMKTPYKGDTLIGKFNGINIDTLISEPIGTVTGFNYNWRVYTKKGTVKDLIIENETIDVRFVKEGDLDGNGSDEWGFIHELETSNWSLYDLYTFNNGEWQRMIEPIRIFKFHFENNPQYGNLIYEDIIQKSNKKGFLKAKFSDIRNDDFIIVDTLLQIKPLSYNQTNIIETDKNLIEGYWKLENYPQIIMKFLEGRYYDPIETESLFKYKIKTDSLIIDNIGWGRQTFKILKLSNDSLHLKLIRQEIFDKDIDEEVIDDEIRIYYKVNNEKE